MPINIKPTPCISFTMNLSTKMLLTAGIAALPLFASAQTAESNIIPRPQNIEMTGHTFRFNANTKVAYKGKEARAVAD